MEKKPTTTKSETIPAQVVTLEGKEYALTLTMGAFLEFKRLTGHEASAIDPDSISDTLIFLHCILKSAARRDGNSYPYETAEDMACHLTPEELSKIRIA